VPTRPLLGRCTFSVLVGADTGQFQALNAGRTEQIEKLEKRECPVGVRISTEDQDGLDSASEVSRRAGNLMRQGFH